MASSGIPETDISGTIPEVRLQVDMIPNIWCSFAVPVCGGTPANYNSKLKARCWVEIIGTSRSHATIKVATSVRDTKLRYLDLYTVFRTLTMCQRNEHQLTQLLN